jgi:hypothetical protein
MASPPVWLTGLIDQVVPQIYGADVLPPLGCHYFRADEGWEVTVFASNTEIVGGEKDGQKLPARFCVDLQKIADLFSNVTGFSWQVQSLGPDDDLGPNVSVEGVYDGQPVWLRILAFAPPQFSSGRYARVYEGCWEDAW